MALKCQKGTLVISLQPEKKREEKEGAGNGFWLK